MARQPVEVAGGVLVVQERAPLHRQGLGDAVDDGQGGLCGDLVEELAPGRVEGLSGPDVEAPENGLGGRTEVHDAGDDATGAVLRSRLE